MDNRADDRRIPTGSTVARIACSREPVMVAFRYLLFGIAVAIGIAHVHMWWQSFSASHVFRKDFIQEFLTARAALGGVDPYLPLPILADKYLGPLPNPVFPHPSPYPPPVVLLSLPAGFLSYEHAAILWFFFELTCLAASVGVLLRWLRVGKRAVAVSLGASLIVLWTPIAHELVLGQLNPVLLVLLLAGWHTLRSGRDVQSGVLLGSAIAVKLIPWPIIIFLMARRYWRATCVTVMTTAIANVASATLIGLDRLTDYYLNIGMAVSSLYRADIANFSLWTIGWRLFGGTGSPVLSDARLPPLVAAPALAPLVSVGIPVAMLILGFWFVVRARTLDTAFGILICIMILVSPIAWDHYLILGLIPLAVAARTLSSLQWPRKETNIALWVGMAFVFPSARITDVWAVGGRAAAQLGPTISIALSLTALVPAIGLLGLVWVLRRLDRIAFQAAPRVREAARLSRSEPSTVSANE